MLTKTFRGKELSMLGLGTMRLPVVNGDNNAIDEAAVAEMVAYAMENGINYYDTAWRYHGGYSETVMGKVLCAYPRESYYLATKFPGFDVSNMNKAEAIFEEQLEKCRVDYFDFYLFHNVCEANIDGYLNEEYGVFRYLAEQKKNGRIRHLGFSIHGGYEVLKRFLDAYGDHMEFCQIQLNYLDWTLQDAKSKVRLLNERNIPIWVMEPLRGGKLVHLNAATEAKLKELRPEEEIREWAFRYLQSVPGVTMILSGMSNMEQLKQNIQTFQTMKPLNAEEMQTLQSVALGMLENFLPCTACRYCTEHCPQGIDIPRILELYNEYRFSGGGVLVPMRLAGIAKEKQPAACIGCKSCEAVCPQQLAIAEAMKDFAKRLEK